MYLHPQFNTDVMKPLKMDVLMDQEVQNLSGGELQRVAITMALGKPADVYLIDEPSAYLDSEQRIVAAKVIILFFVSLLKSLIVESLIMNKSLENWIFTNEDQERQLFFQHINYISQSALTNLSQVEVWLCVRSMKLYWQKWISITFCTCQTVQRWRCCPYWDSD